MGLAMSAASKERIVYLLSVTVIAVLGSLGLDFLFKGLDGLLQDLAPTTIIPMLLAPPIAWDAILKRQKISELNAKLNLALDHDVLTNAKSRKFLFERYEAVAERDEAFPMAVMMVDADRFKQINDTYGHMVGDAALKHLSDALRAECGADDVVCRLGGEEFAMVFPETTEAQSTPIALRVLDRLNSSYLQTAAGPIAVRASIGMTMQRRGENLNGALARADTALYSAKESGRNCAMMAHDDGRVVMVARGAPLAAVKAA
jgi:diguanylate cyclase (GGDEF)-like protein